MSELDVLRTRMDQLTIQMLRLLQERIAVAHRIGDIKKESGMTIHDELREENLRKMVLGVAPNIGIDPDVAGRFLNHILLESFRVQSENGTGHLAVFKRAKEMEAAGHSIIHMEVGEPDMPPPSKAAAALSRGFRAGHTRYGLPAGMPAFRSGLSEYIQDKFSVPCGPQNILVTPGARFAVFAAITTLLHSGDEILIIEPTWPAYREAAMSANIKIRIMHTTIEDGWEPDLTLMESTLTPRTRMIVLCYPSNPTGKILPPRLMDGIIQMASKHGLYVLSDEIYYDYHTHRPKSLLEYEYERGIVTQSFSKSHAMPGLRIGNAVAPPDIINTMTSASALCLTGVAGVIQYAALECLSYDTSHNVRTIRERLRRMSAMAKKANMEFVEPDGAMYLFARAPDISCMELVEECLRRGLALAPGMGFGHYPEFVRISAGTSMVDSGMHILYETLKEKSWKR